MIPLSIIFLYVFKYVYSLGVSLWRRSKLILHRCTNLQYVNWHRTSAAPPPHSWACHRIKKEKKQIICFSKKNGALKELKSFFSATRISKPDFFLNETHGGIREGVVRWWFGENGTAWGHLHRKTLQLQRWRQNLSHRGRSPQMVDRQVRESYTQNGRRIQVQDW